MLVSDVLSWLTRISWLSGQWDEAMRYAAEGIDALDGLPESPALATALARRSQLEMLRGDLLAEAHAEEAIAVATRVGDDFAATNARINLITAKAARGVQPDRDHAFAVFAGAIEAGYLDEAYRLAVNYLWSASPHEPIPELRDVLAVLTDQLEGVHAVEFGSYHRYLTLSRAKFLWIPGGEWARVDEDLATLGELAVDGSNRLLKRQIACGMALRRGDIATVDELLPDWIEKAMASQEPQRTIPMAAVALARAWPLPSTQQPFAPSPRWCSKRSTIARSGRRSQAPPFRARCSPSASSISSSRLRRRWSAKATTARYTHAVALACTGLRALAEGRPSHDSRPAAGCRRAGARTRGAGQRRMRGAGRGARPRRHRGRRSRQGGTGSAHAVLAPLGCVNPV